MRLAVEFQGFSRHLHDIAAGTFGRWAAPHDAQVGDLIEGVLTEGRRLDRGNATEGNLTSDFRRFGLQLSPVMEDRDSRTRRRFTELTRLNRARNAIAYDDPRALEDLRREGQPIQLTTIKQWQGSLNGLASTMDAVMAEHLAAIFDRTPPW